MRQDQVCLALVLALSTAACDDFRPGGRQAASQPAQPVSVTDGSNTPALAPASQAPVGQSIETAAITPAPPTGTSPTADAATAPSAASDAAATSPSSPDAAVPAGASDSSSGPPPNLPTGLSYGIVRAETLLDRAHFSPGVIDGRPGENLTRALAAFRAANGLGAGGTLDQATLDALEKTSPGPVTQDYTLTQADEAGPFIGDVPDKFVQLAKLDHTGYHDVVEELAERFHMTPRLLKALNPGADFTKVGTRIVVIQPGMAPLPAPAGKVVVDKSTNQVRVFDRAGKIEAVFPATVGSTERPAPTGELKVLSVTADPTYTYDPSKLTFGPKSQGKLTIKPGPNNPVGTTWIAVDNNGDGIHGTPDPAEVGKTASHGCVRLTNWDAASLRGAVTKGTPVDFVGVETKATTPGKT